MSNKYTNNNVVNNNVVSATSNNYIIWTVSYMMQLATQAVQIFQSLYGCDFVVEEKTMDEIEDRLANYGEISELPDLLLVHDSYLQKYIRQYPNLFVNLDSVLDVSIYNNAKIMNVSLHGVPYGCPCTCEPVALYYNKEFADNYGININESTTWDEFIEFGRMLKENEGIYLLPPAKYLTEVLMRATGSLYYDEYGNISSAGALEVLELIETLTTEGLLYPDNTIQDEEIAVRIINGEIFSVIGGPYWFSRIKTLSAEQGSVYNFAVSRTPKNSVLMYEADLGGFSWLVVDKGDSEATQAMTDFLSIMFNQDNNEIQDLFSNVLTSCDLVPCVTFLGDLLDGLDNGCFVEPPVIKFLVEISSDVPEIYYGTHTEDLTDALTNIIIEISNGVTTSSQGASDFDGLCADYGEVLPPLILDYIEIDRAPDKTDYYDSEFFDPSGMIVHAYFVDGSDMIVNYYEWSPDSLSYGDTEVTIRYSSGGVTDTATQAVTVYNRTLEHITATTRKTFLHGDDIDSSAFSVTAHYNAGPPRTVTATRVYPETLSNEDEQDIIVEYENKSTSVTVKVYRKLESIEIITNPSKMSYYKGERFNRNGMSACAKYSNGETATISSGSLKVNPSIVKFKDGQDRATITVSYTERSVTKQDVLTVYKKTGSDLEDCEITQDMAGGGFGTVNLSTGKIRYSFEDYVGSDSIIPITISHVYNQDMGNECFVGNNWRLNLQQEIVKKSGKWQYTDKKGKQYLFDDGYEISSERSAVRNEKLGLDLFEVAEENIIYLVDRSNNTLVFKQINSKYRLTSMHIYPSTKTNPIDAYSLSITQDTAGRITKVTSGKKIGGVRPSVEFIYSNNLLSELKYTQSGTTYIAKYSYDNNNLSRIELCHSNIDSIYSRITEFQYNEAEFIVKDLSSKNANDIVKSLTYSLDDLYRVNQINVGYGATEQDITSLSYSENAVETGTNTNISLTTLIENNGTVSVYSFNSFGVVSQYSCEIENDLYAKPKKINSAQSCGFSYKSLADTFSDTLDVYHDDFETDNCGWIGATLTNSKAVYGEQSIRGTNLYKTYALSSAVLDRERTMYLSLWVLGNTSGSEITVSVEIQSDSETGTMEHKVDKRLANKWQYVVLCLGKRKTGDSIKVTVEGSTVYVDEVRLTRLPHETPDDIADTTYDNFGNVTKSFKYNPVSESVEHTEYTYNSNHQLTEEKVFATKLKSKTQNIYDDNGLLTHKKSYGTSSNYLMEQNIYDSDNHVLTSFLDADNVVTRYGDGANYETVTIVGDTNSPDMSQRNEYFNNSGIVENIISGQLQNNFKYLTDGSIDKIKFNHTDDSYTGEYALEYDTFGNTKSLKIGTTPIVSLEYDYKHLNKETYANNDTVEYGYDIKDRTTSIKENGNEFVTFAYSDNENDLVTVAHSNGPTYTSQTTNKNSVTGEYKVVYPNLDRILRIVGYATNNKGNISTTRYFVDNSETPFETVVYTKDSLGQLSSLERTGHGANVSYTYDSLYNLSKKETIYTVNSTTKKYTVDYEYNTIDSYRKGARITKESFAIGSTTNSIGYEYYRNGNIAKVKENDTVKAEYVYDEYDRLVWEYNYTLLRAYKFSYDNGGNITQKETYVISGDNVAGTPTQIDNYNYYTVVSDSGQNSAWHDQLKSYNGTAITYDALGNPLNYLGKIMTWQGRRLTSIDGVALKYDYNGLRTQKGDRTYYWQSDNLIMERWVKNGAENYIYYYYDESGVCGMNYNGTEYYYRKNILGDVIAIYDSLGNLQCTYKYDAWGNHKVYNASGNEIGTEVINVGNVNPLRYRGYYWDSEFSLYYLQSRYYDPALGRFISADSISYLDPESVVGLNLYAYCGNNPVMSYDPEGTWDWSKFWQGVGMVVTAITAVGLAVTTFGAGIPLAMGVIAGVTLAAGVLTGINGIATIVEAGTNYNFVRDGVFQGNETAYNIYAGITEGVAAVGSMILGVYHTTGQYKAAKASQKYLGKGYAKASKNRWISKDGLRQVRWDTTHHMYNGQPSPLHFNWYEYSSPITAGVRNKPIKDIHIWLKWFSYHM